MCRDVNNATWLKMRQWAQQLQHVVDSFCWQCDHYRSSAADGAIPCYSMWSQHCTVVYHPTMGPNLPNPLGICKSILFHCEHIQRPILSNFHLKTNPPGAKESVTLKTPPLTRQNPPCSYLVTDFMIWRVYIRIPYSPIKFLSAVIVLCVQHDMTCPTHVSAHVGQNGCGKRKSLTSPTESTLVLWSPILD